MVELVDSSLPTNVVQQKAESSINNSATDQRQREVATRLLMLYSLTWGVTCGPPSVQLSS